MTGNTRNRKSKKLHNIVLTGLFSAIIFVFTAYIHIPSGSGYTHAGDGLIYLAACILPTPYAAASAAIGGALADGLAGFPVWIPATIAIKSVTVLFFTSKTSKILTLRNICGIIPYVKELSGGTRTIILTVLISITLSVLNELISNEAKEKHP
mgnify:CR=1 FL=1